MSIDMQGLHKEYCFNTNEYREMVGTDAKSIAFDEGTINSLVERANSDSKGILVALKASDGIKFNRKVCDKCPQCPNCPQCAICPECSNTGTITIIAVIIAVIILIAMIFYFFR